MNKYFEKNHDALAEKRLLELRPIINLFFMCFLLTPESIDLRSFSGHKDALMFYSLFTKAFISVLYWEDLPEDPYKLNQLNKSIMTLNDRFILCLEDLLDTKEKI